MRRKRGPFKLEDDVTSVENDSRGDELKEEQHVAESLFVHVPEDS